MNDKNMSGSPERGRARIHSWADQLGRKWGKSTALPLSTAPVAQFQRLPFGILTLDWKTGGGLVMGRINRLWGKKSTLKSTLCLRALRQAQNHCRYCRCPIVADPGTGEVDCRCPNPRYWLQDEEDYGWLSQEDAIAACYGELPEAAQVKSVKGVGKVPVLACDPPPHLQGGKRKKKDVVFVEDYRCEPMRCVYVDTEGTIDSTWAEANGVDTSLVLLVGGQWAEQSLETLEDAILTREFDLIILDSTSMMEVKGEIEKTFHDRRKIGTKATLMSRFAKRYVAACAETGLTARLRPTLLCTSQVTTKGIGGPTPAWLGPTDGHTFDHAIALDVKMIEAGYTFDKAGEKAIKGAFAFQIRKNKAGGSVGAKGQITFWLQETEKHPVGDSDDLGTVMRYARDMGHGYIEDGAGSNKLILYSDYLEDGSGGFSRVGDCEQFLRDNPTIYDDLRARVLKALMDAGETLEVIG